MRCLPKIILTFGYIRLLDKKHKGKLMINQQKFVSLIVISFFFITQETKGKKGQSKNQT